jgi:hypothetical protein
MTILKHVEVVISISTALISFTIAVAMKLIKDKD